MKLHRSMLIAGGIALAAASGAYAMDDAAQMDTSAATTAHKAKRHKANASTSAKKRMKSPAGKDSADMGTGSAQGANTASHDAKSERIGEMHEGMKGAAGMNGKMMEGKKVTSGRHGHEVNRQRDASGAAAGGTGSSSATQGQTESAATPTDDSTAAHPAAADDAQRP